MRRVSSEKFTGFSCAAVVNIFSAHQHKSPKTTRGEYLNLTEPSPENQPRAKKSILKNRPSSATERTNSSAIPVHVREVNPCEVRRVRIKRVSRNRNLLEFQKSTADFLQSGDTTTEDESECEERQRLIGDNSLSEQSEKTTTHSAEAPIPADAAAAAAPSALKPSMQQVRRTPNYQAIVLCFSLSLLLGICPLNPL